MIISGRVRALVPGEGFIIGSKAPESAAKPGEDQVRVAGQMVFRCSSPVLGLLS